MKYFITSLATLLISTTGFTQDLVKADAEVTVHDMSENPIPNATIYFINTEKEQSLKGISDNNGKFHIDLAPGNYNIRLKANGKTKDYTFIEIPELEKNQEYGTVQIMIQYEEQSSFILSDLHFKTNEAIIQESSFNELDELVKYLKSDESLKIEIAGHTDSDGSNKSNQELSQKRAEAVKQYLKDKGVSEDRLTAKGYGEIQPIADNGTDMGKAMNRRTEIHFLADDGSRLVK